MLETSTRAHEAIEIAIATAIAIEAALLVLPKLSTQAPTQPARSPASFKTLQPHRTYHALKRVYTTQPAGCLHTSAAVK